MKIKIPLFIILMAWRGLLPQNVGTISGRVVDAVTQQPLFYVNIQNVYNYKFQMIPQYDFWEDRVIDRGDIGILPSIGISLEF